MQCICMLRYYPYICGPFTNILRANFVIRTLRVCRGGARRQGRQQQSNFVDDDHGEEAFVADCKTPPQPARKFFAHLHLIHGGKTKVVKAQIDSASTCMERHNCHMSFDVFYMQTSRHYMQCICLYVEVLSLYMWSVHKYIAC